MFCCDAEHQFRYGLARTLDMLIGPNSIIGSRISLNHVRNTDFNGTVILLCTANKCVQIWCWRM